MSNPLSHAIQRLAYGSSLSAEETAAAFGVVMRGEAQPAQIAALLMGLRVKGESAEEIAGAASALRAAMVPLVVRRPDLLVDTCGTGGGVVGTFNISTAAAFVAVGAGIRVAKHGNRSYTSRSGSADVLEAAGVDIGISPERAARVLEDVGIVFLFAPAYHPAMRHVAPTRKELGVPTVMNLLGPLVNPAGASRQVLGVADAVRAPAVSHALARLGCTHALVVHAEVGMDEISPHGRTRVWEVEGGRVTEWLLDPAEFGLAQEDLGALAGGSPEENARRMGALLGGARDPVARAAVVLNAAAAIYVSSGGGTFREAVGKAQAALDQGKAAEAFARLREMAPR